MSGRGRTLPITCMPSSKIGAPTPVGKVRPVLTVVPGAGEDDDSRWGGGSGRSVIDELVREGARRMLAEALQAEVDDYIARFVGELDAAGRRLVVRNGSHQPREVLTSSGAVEVVAPRVNDRRVDPGTGQRVRFSSAILPPWCRKEQCLRPVDHEEGRTLPMILRLSSKAGGPTPVGRVRPVLTVVPGAAANPGQPVRNGGSLVIDELVREGARRMLAEALQAEVDDYIARFAADRDERGRRLVVRNGSHQPREVLTSSGAVEVVAPRVNDRRVDPG